MRHCPYMNLKFGNASEMGGGLSKVHMRAVLDLAFDPSHMP